MTIERINGIRVESINSKITRTAKKKMIVNQLVIGYPGILKFVTPFGFCRRNLICATNIMIHVKIKVIVEIPAITSNIPAGII